MINEAMQEALADLRSGKYEQGRGGQREYYDGYNDITYLDKYCALGVLALRFHANTGRGHWGTGTDAGAFILHDAPLPQDTHLSPEILDYFELWAGLESQIVAWNDSDKLSLSEVADRLEEKLEAGLENDDD